MSRAAYNKLMGGALGAVLLPRFTPLRSDDIFRCDNESCILGFGLKVFGVEAHWSHRQVGANPGCLCWFHKFGRKRLIDNHPPPTSSNPVAISEGSIRIGNVAEDIPAEHQVERFVVCWDLLNAALPHLDTIGKPGLLDKPPSLLDVLADRFHSHDLASETFMQSDAVSGITGTNIQNRRFRSEAKRCHSVEQRR
ncbi:MAG: hypothetical protein O6923_06795 [Actinobacteria bacterium]|nr:hypothetical protein [Actinomycetota bacterium]